VDPLAQLDRDRAEARRLEDPCANLCTVASVDAAGSPQARTLVLRDLNERLAIFANETSPKWQEISQNARISVVVWLPILNLQYRLRCGTERVPTHLVHDSWHQRPEPPKRLDWFYTNHLPQSSRLPDRETLLERLAQIDLPEPLAPPQTAAGLYLSPTMVERLDLNQSNGIHDRRHFELSDDGWVQSVLVP
jgi:pyridoxamine 5'-phosphate oxidase